MRCEDGCWFGIHGIHIIKDKKKKKKKKKERKGEEKERERKEKRQKEGEQKKRLFSLHVKLPVEPSAFVSLVPAQHSPIFIQSHPLVVPLLQNIT